MGHTAFSSQVFQEQITEKEYRNKWATSLDFNGLSFQTVFVFLKVVQYKQAPFFVQSQFWLKESFPSSLDFLKQILHLEVQIGLSFFGLFAEHLKSILLFLLVPLNGFFSLLLVLQILLGFSKKNMQKNKRQSVSRKSDRRSKLSKNLWHFSSCVIFPIIKRERPHLFLFSPFFSNLLKFLFCPLIGGLL